jgi:multidrug efflux system outer membrane protein
MKKLFFLAITIITLGTGCSLAPDYTRPEAPVSTEWPAGPAYKEIRTETLAPQAQDMEWQAFFTDQRMRKVIRTALSHNRDLRLAALNVQRARALYGIQEAELFPSFNATGSGIRQRIPADLSMTGKETISSQYSVNFGITAWEIDFFGRIRNLKDRALEEFLATEQARRSAQISIVSAVAGAYLNLAAARDHLRMAESTLRTQKEAFKLIRRRYEIGLVSELDVHRARIQVETARGDLARFTQQAAQAENALNLLVGSPAPVPEELLPPGLTDIPSTADISPGIPSGVLLRRPDILAAEHRLKGAYANIGAARAAFFPRISLTTTVGTASRELTGLFKAHSAVWSFAPQIVLPIFDARLWSAHRVTKVDREIALTRYEKAIQTAFREVADALAVQGTVDAQMAAQESLVSTLAETHRLSTVRYNKGIDSYLGVLDAQRSLYAAEQGLISIRLARAANQVRLFAVLGGGSE